jgi:hypothetical protein
VVSEKRKLQSADRISGSVEYVVYVVTSHKCGRDTTDFTIHSEGAGNPTTCSHNGCVSFDNSSSLNK